MSDIQSVLKGWHMLESVEPCEVSGNRSGLSGDFFTDQQKRNKVRRLNDLTEKPWEQDLLMDKYKYTHKMEYKYYLGCFQQYRLVKIFRELFQSNEDIINRDKTKLCSMTFKVDQKGNYVEDSVFVPMVMYMMKVLKNSDSFSYKTIQNEFEDIMKQFKEEVSEFFLNGISDQSIVNVQKAYKRYFHQVEEKNIIYLQSNVFKKDTETMDDNMHSFYLADMGKIINQGVNNTLSDFIRGSTLNKRINVNENASYIEDILQPENLPDGRWPSRVNYRLSLMQQVAVNQVMKNGRNINSVNGPPGTGKTTLLKDIFADLMVQRANAMSKLENPKQAFKKIDKLELDGYYYTVYQLDEALNKFSMVVASSNNGAVENISKELPQRKEVSRPPEGESPFKEYEINYRTEAEQLSMFPEVAESLLEDDEEAWGLFSAALGKNDNISKLATILINKKHPSTFMNQLNTEAEKVTKEDWKAAVNEFKQLQESVQAKKADLQKFSKAYNNVKKKVQVLNDLQIDASRIKEQKDELEEKISNLEEKKAEKHELLDLLPERSFIKKLFRKRDEKQEELKADLYNLTTKLSETKEEYRQLKKQSTKIKQQQAEIEKEKKMLDEQWTYYKSQRIDLPDTTYWGDNIEAYEHRQEKVIWQTDELNYERGLLFLKAMKLHKYLLLFNITPVFNASRILKNKQQLDLNVGRHREALKQMWKSIHMITPVISTTFASLGSMYRGIGADFIDYLFIDEAGQASPQQAAGGLWRAKRAIVVGDPLQIEPVVTTDKTVLEDIKTHFSIGDRYIGMNASVQALADLANPYGTYIGENDWIGSPLWVHRRCKNPMFTIANEIAYENRMVLPEPKEIGRSIWFDCKGKAVNRHYVEEQGDMMAEHIAGFYHQENQLPNLYVITPFTAVKEGVRQAVKKRLKESVPKNKLQVWLKTAVGTVHTFQGKEADTVYVITGTDAESDGAANWSCVKPNLLNVAVTRAKKQFYVIGDYERFKNKQFYKTIIENIGEIER